jgi:hypothetical protein
MLNADYKKPDFQFYATWVLFSIVSGVTAFIVYLLIAKTYNAFAGGLDRSQRRDSHR